MRKGAALAGLMSLPFVAAAAASQDGVGEAKAVVQQATAAGQIGERTLAVGSTVFLGDAVKTDAAGEAQLLFRDGTRMVVGPNSSLVIDQFVFRSQAQENSFAVRALGGAFRFISGNAPKDAYLIHTPAATIGVRGTIFDFTATPAATDLLLLEKGPPDGGAVVCAPGADCEQADETCELVSAERGEGVKVVEDETARAERIRDRFPYVASQAGLAEEFRVKGEDGGDEPCLVLLAQSGSQQAPATAAAGPGLPTFAAPVGGLAIIGGVVFGALSGGDSSGTTSTTSTTGTTSAD